MRAVQVRLCTTGLIVLMMSPHVSLWGCQQQGHMPNPTPSANNSPQSLPPRPHLSPLPPTALKYRLRDYVQDALLYCGPHVGIMSVDPTKRYPQFPQIVENAEEFLLIAQHTGIPETGPWSEQHKQTVMKERRMLSAIRLEPGGNHYKFRVRVLPEEGGVSATQALSDPGRPHLPMNALEIEGTIDLTGLIRVSGKTPIFHTCPNN